MNKLFTKIATAFVGIAMAIGVGVAVGSHSEVRRADAADTTITLAPRSVTSVANKTDDNGKTWVMASDAQGFTSSTSYVHAGSGKKTVSYLRFSTTAYNSDTIKKIQLFGAAASNSAATLKIYVGGTLKAESETLTNNASSGGTELSWNNNDSSSGEIKVEVSRSSASKKAVYFNQAIVTLASGAQKLTTPTNLNYDSTNQRVTWDSVSNASSYKFSSDNGTSYTSTGTNLYASVSGLTTGTTYNCKVVAVGDGSSYTDSDAASFQFTKTEPPVYTSVTVTGGAQQGTEKGSAYIQCSASATGTNIPASPSFTWYVTENATYGTTTSVTNKASIDNTGKVTFDDNCTVYVWALAPDGTTHNTSGYAATASNLTDPKGSESNPYTCAEARSIATDTANNTHVTGIIYDVDSYNSTYHSLTYWISDDGTGDKTNKDGLQIYSGKGLNGADFSGTSDLTVGSTVVVQGDLKVYKTTTYELDKNSVIKSIQLPKTISSIAVKTAPDKTAYKSGESFDPTGLVITVTYSDTTTEDVPYAGHSGSFSFSPTTITAAGNVEITYQEKTCNQAVTLVTVTNVTGVASAPSEVYKDGSIDPSSVTLNVTYSDSTSGTVNPDTVTCDTSSTGPKTATATYNAATGTKSATFDVTVKKAPTYDYVTDSIVYSDLTATSTGYTNFSNLTKTTEAVYKGNTSLQDSTMIGFRSGTTSGQSQHSGIVTTSSGGSIYQVTVTDFDHATRILDVYGSNTAYSDPNDLYESGKGTKLGSLTKSSQSLTVTGDYAYVGIRSNDGLIKVSSINFVWKIEGAANPLIENPTLSTGSATTIVVGKTTTLTITTNPVDSDEKLTVTSDDTTCVSVAGSDRSYTLHALATGSATVTVAGVKGTFKSSVVVTVIQAQKTYEDKILTATSLGLAASYADSDGSHSYEDVEYVTTKVCKSSGMQFQKDNGELYNNEELYSTNNIKSITLVMNSGNKNQPVVYEGSSAQPTSGIVTPLTTFSDTGVNTYVFSSGMPFFRIGASSSGAVNIDTIIIELEDSADSVLEEARLAALAILTDLSGNCGDGGSGEVTPAEWNTLNADLTELKLSDDAKQFLKDADRILLGNLSQGGAEIENAMAHYDACVEKFGYTPFTGITSAQAHRIIPIALISSKSTNTSIIVIVTVGIAAIAIGGYFLLRKKKED